MRIGSITNSYYGYPTQAVSPLSQQDSQGTIVNPGESTTVTPGRKSSPAECKTCRNRKYQDGSEYVI